MEFGWRVYIRFILCSFMENADQSMNDNLYTNRMLDIYFKNQHKDEGRCGIFNPKNKCLLIIIFLFYF